MIRQTGLESYHVCLVYSYMAYMGSYLHKHTCNILNLKIRAGVYV